MINTDLIKALSRIEGINPQDFLNVVKLIEKPEVNHKEIREVVYNIPCYDLERIKGIICNYPRLIDKDRTDEIDIRVEKIRNIISFEIWEKDIVDAI